MSTEPEEAAAGDEQSGHADVGRDPALARGDMYRMRIVEVSGTLDFWDRPEEDIYSLEDGEPV